MPLAVSTQCSITILSSRVNAEYALLLQKERNTAYTGIIYPEVHAISICVTLCRREREVTRRDLPTMDRPYRPYRPDTSTADYCIRYIIKRDTEIEDLQLRSSYTFYPAEWWIHPRRREAILYIIWMHNCDTERYKLSSNEIFKTFSLGKRDSIISVAARWIWQFRRIAYLWYY